MENIQENKLWIWAAVAMLVMAEMIWSYRNDKKVYHLKETFSNLAILAGFQFSKLLFTGYQLGVLAFVSDFAFFKIPHRLWAFLLCFLLADFIYYWFHRASHHWKPLWAFHVVHHTGMNMNLTTAYRLNWLGALISPLFLVPLSLAGFPSDFIVLSYGLNLLYQFFLHTEAVNRIGPLEGILDTPSAHRVHHGSNPEYIDKNFGGVFILWDRLFGTYQPETVKPSYGVTTGFAGYNPFRLIFGGFIDLIKNKMSYKG